MDKVSGIYAIKNIINNKMYIGRSINIYSRWNSHKKCLNNNCHGNDHLQKSWNKHGYCSFEFIILERCEELLLNEKETYWIIHYKTHDGNYGYNKSYGGEDGHLVPESIEKIRIKQTGKKYSKETNKKKGRSKYGAQNSMYGKKRSIEARIKTSQKLKGNVPWNKGIMTSIETKNKISNSTKELNNPRSKVDIDLATKIIKDQYILKMNIAELSQKYNLSRDPITKIYKGVHWTNKYINIEDILKEDIQ